MVALAVSSRWRTVLSRFSSFLQVVICTCHCPVAAATQVERRVGLLLDDSTFYRYMIICNSSDERPGAVYSTLVALALPPRGKAEKLLLRESFDHVLYLPMYQALFI